MVKLDYMAHQEQYEPDELLNYCRQAERAGFDMIWSSDHFHPWFHSQGSNGFAWSWLGAATQQLDVPLGTCVTPAAGHYHPGLIAQAFATLKVMHSDEIILGLSTGEAMNQKPLGYRWPDYPERRDRLEESLEIIQLLWDSDEFVTYSGEHYDLNEARLYTKPTTRPQIFIAANGPQTAALTADHGDGFITVLKGDEFTDRLYPAVRQYTTDAGRDPDDIETTVLVTASYDPDLDEAFRATKPWWAATQDVFDRGIANPKEIEKIGEQATEEEVRHKFLIADSAEVIAQQLENYREMGFDRIALGNTSPNPETFLEIMGDEVIPAL